MHVKGILHYQGVLTVLLIFNQNLHFWHVVLAQNPLNNCSFTVS